MKRRRLLAGAAAGPLATLLRPAPLAALGALFPAAAAAQATDHLELSPPLPVATPADAIEVLELFWYGCPHCHRLEPLLGRWAATLPPDVRLRRLPAVLADNWRPAARLHFTLAALGRLDALHAAVFEAEHVTGRLQVQSRDPAAFADWAEAQGLSRAAFLDAWHSAAVATRVEDAARLTQPLRRIGVPALVVDGRYLSTASMTGTHETLLATALRLADRVRAERAGSR